MIFKLASLLDLALKVPLVAELGDDVAIAVAGEDLEALEHVGVAELLEDVDLREEQFLQLLALEGLELDDLDGHDVVCICRGVLEISWWAR